MPNRMAKLIYDGKMNQANVPPQLSPLVNYWLGKLHGAAIFEQCKTSAGRAEALDNLPEELKPSAREAVVFLWHRNRYVSKKRSSK